MSLLAALTLLGALGCEDTASPGRPGGPVSAPRPAAPSAARWPNEVNLIGAGDISWCTNFGDESTARILDTIPGTVFTAGDNAYQNGTAAEYTNCYQPTWGRHKGRTRPSPGNHDYYTTGAAAYYAYFGSQAGRRAGATTTTSWAPGTWSRSTAA
jgi:hypothetical protein